MNKKETVSMCKKIGLLYIKNENTSRSKVTEVRIKFNAVKAMQLETNKKLYYKPELQQTDKGRKRHIGQYR